MRNRVTIVIIAVLLILAASLYIVLTPEGLENNQQGVSSAAARGSVVINEVMASNPGVIPDENGAFPDWVELYNPSQTQSVDLSGWGLSNEAEEVKWAFPVGSVVQPGEYLTIYCDGSSETPVFGQALHASFRIKVGAKPIVLSDAAGRVVEEVLSPKLADGMSWGRGEDGSAFIALAPSPGYANGQAGIDAYHDSMKNTESPLIINEVQPSNRLCYPGDDNNYPDWIEIYNPSDDAIDIGGYGLSDDRNQPLMWLFPAGASIGSGEYLLVFCGAEGRSGLQAPFGLNGYEESVLLCDPYGKRIDAVDYKSIPTDGSYARDAHGQWRISVTPTPGYPNTDEGHETFQSSIDLLLADSPLYISEVMMANRERLPDPDGDHYDWVELHNPSDAEINLSGYGLSNDSKNPGKWRFPAGSSIQAGQRLILYATGVSTARQKTAAHASIPYVDFQLDNLTGEILTLWTKDDQLVDLFSCPTQYDWSSSGRAQKNAPRRIYLTPQPGQDKPEGYRGYASPPLLHTPAGLYSGAQSIQAESAQPGLSLHYTLDGNTPTKDSPRWKQDLHLQRTTALRLRNLSKDPLVLPSRTVTATYLIDSPHLPALGIVSLTTDPANLFDEQTGIYMPGPNGTPDNDYLNANFRQDWERPAHIEIFAPDGGKEEISQDIAVRIFGDYGRLRDQKGFALINRSAYGYAAFDAPLFASRPFASYQSLILRAGSQDATVTKLHDIVATSLVDGNTHLDVQAYRQAVLYVNGEYFGYYNIREKVNKYWIEQHYGIDPTQLDLLVGNGTALVGSNADYKKLINYCASHDLSDPLAYAHVSKQIDIENYIDYLIAEMYVANTDTGNIKFFRERSNDPARSKWRWIYYDFCWSFLDTDMDSFAYLTNPKGHGVENAYSTQLNRALFQNQDFCNQFLRRFAQLLGSVYQPEHVLARIEECEALLYEEKKRDGERWPGEEGSATFGAWLKNMEHMKAFAAERSDYCIGFLRKHFSLNEPDTLRIFGAKGKFSPKWNEAKPTPEGGQGSAPAEETPTGPTPDAGEDESDAT